MARMGGDEFAVLLDNVTDIADVSAVVDRIRTALDRPFDIEGFEIGASASVGIALGSESGQQAEAMIRAADAAMYRAKTLGER
jgi:diguanylate cyclase (GGDEF)-like protein